MTEALLSDPFLQHPTDDAVQVVWFTEFDGERHWVEWGRAGSTAIALTDPQDHRAQATTTLLSRSREDADSRPENPHFQDLTGVVERPIWRHQATVSGLEPGQRYPYRVISQTKAGLTVMSRVFTLAAAPAPGQGIKILLTSDHQNLPMVAANLQKAAETLGRVDAVFVAGDLVNVPDRTSEWFDNRRGNAFFPALQGRAHYRLERNGQGTVYHGGEIIQHAPLFPALGNHEVMGQYGDQVPLKDQFNQAVPRAVAEGWYEAQAETINPQRDEAVRQQWIVEHSFNSDTYDEIFSLPQSVIPDSAPPATTSHYYAITLGDVRLVSLYVTQIWRSPSLDPTVRGRYQERQADLEDPEQWGYGQHIFEAIDPDSPQYQWLAQELASDEFRRAKYKVVMLHHPPHTLGDNIVPAFTTPIPIPEYHPDSRLKALRYDYPLADDYIARDLVPLLEAAGTNLVFYGHSHLWNRFTAPGGTHYLETSNVGNSYGAFWQDQARPVPSRADMEIRHSFNPDNYVAQGDPNGLSPITPTLAPPMVDDEGNPLPYLASNDLTAFSVLDTASGTVSSYAFDTSQPNSTVVKFDEFRLE